MRLVSGGKGAAKRRGNAESFKKDAVAGIVSTSRAGPKLVRMRPVCVAQVAADTFSSVRA